jgi:hypothetical protein
VFEQTVQNIAHMGVATHRARLIVAVSKADLVKVELTDLGLRDEQAIRNWLSDDLELDHMVRAMDHAFKEVRFVLTTALLDEGRADPSVEAMATSTLSGEGVRL